MTLQEFIAKYNGKGIDHDGHYGFQCVDLYRKYVQEVLNYPQSIGVSGAKDIWNTYLQEYFTRIANTPDGIPEPGDIMIWGDSYGPYGHVAVVTKATLTTFTCFSQNDPTGSLCGEKLYRTYKPVLGWLHPKTPSTSYRGYDLTNLDSMKVCVDDHVRVVEGQLVDKSQYESIKGQLTESQKRVGELSQQLGDSNSTNKALTNKIESLNIVVGEYQKEDAVQISQLKESYERETTATTARFLLIKELRAELKLSSTMDDIDQAEKEAVEALQKLYQSNISLQSKVKDLEAEVKKLNTHKLPISKLSIKEVIIILIEKIKEKYGKK